MATKKSNKKNQSKSHIPFRLNLLFFIIFLLFVILIVRSGYLQIIKGEEFQAEVERTESTIVRGNVPRGEITDSEFRPLVKNEAKNTIMYTRGSNTKTENMAQAAYNLAHLIDIPHSSPFEEERSDLSIRDLKDYYYAQNSEVMDDRVEKYLEENDISPNDFSYSDQLELINEAELRELTDHDLKAAAIFTQMNSAYALSTVNIKSEDVTEEEIARVNEHSILLPGISTGTDWNRVYPQGDTLTSVLGRVTTEKQGIPEDKEEAYLAKGYSRNDRVGSSQLEEQYEDVLRGSKSRSKTETDNKGEIITQDLIYPGSKGDNLILTIDMDFQERVDQILEDVLQNPLGLNNSIYAVALDPNNGNVLAMSGRQLNKEGEIVDSTLGTIQSAFGMGSSVKAATVLMGYMDGVITLDDNTMVDRRLSIKGSEDISSVFNRHGSVPVNDITALKYSSNVYMSLIAMRMGGYYNFQQNQGLPIDAKATADKMRSYYHQFGLGSETGIDLPNESTGQSSDPGNPGQTLFLSFGQFDTYTPMQLAQYAATIANGGIRYAPRVVSEIRSTDPETGEIGKLVADVQPKIMNTINVQDEAMERVQTGLYEVVNGGYGSAYHTFAGTPYVAAGKTGTAQASYWGGRGNPQNGTEVTNTTFIGYAPYDNPEIAIAVVIPYLPNNNTGGLNTRVSRQILDAYFEVGRYENAGAEDASDSEEEESADNNNSDEDETTESSEEE